LGQRSLEYKGFSAKKKTLKENKQLERKEILTKKASKGKTNTLKKEIKIS